MSKEYTKRVEDAAIFYNGVVYSLPRPARHHDIINHICETLNISQLVGEEQGFTLEDGRFARRQAAAYIALRAGQIDKLKWGYLLYSEDLW